MNQLVCVLLFVALSSAIAQEFDESTSVNRNILNISGAKNGSLETGGFIVLKLWERFSKIIELTNARSEQCRRDSQLYLNSLNRLELWALKMFDATAKPPSGILSGNGNQYGDFDECLSIDGTIKGKYCLASLQVTIRGNDEMKAIDYFVHSGHFMRSNLTDPSNVFAQYSSLLWGVCIPSSCSNYDLEMELSQRLSNLAISVRVDSNMCTLKDNKTPYSFGALFSIAYFAAIGLLLSLGTILDNGKNQKSKFDQFLNAFSLKRNFRSLLDFTDGPTKVKGLDAFRGINALLIIIIHKSLAILHQSFVNKLDFSDVVKLIWIFPIRLPTLYVDSFLYISGFLNAHSLLRELEQKGSINFTERFISRWFRLFPVFISLVWISTDVLKDINNGPKWNLIMNAEHRNCKNNIWRSIFFMQNYFPFEEMCLPHTHQIGIDMQLYLITVPLMVVIWKYRVIGWSLLATIAIISTVLRYLATYWYDINLIMYSEISVHSTLNMLNNSYILPTHKSTVYLLGVIMAYVIKYKKISVRLSNAQSRLLWFFCFGLVALTFLSPYKMSRDGYQFKHLEAALFAAFLPILWGLVLAISQWAICNDYAGIATPFLESRVFKFYQKISYSVYLIHVLIMYYNVATTRNAGYFSLLNFVNIPEIVVILVLSITTTVTIEMPFVNVYKIFFGKSSKQLKDK